MSNLPPVLTGHVVRTNGGYGLSVTSNGILGLALTSAETTFWGVPAAAIHDPQRGLFCARGDRKWEEWYCGADEKNPSDGSGGEASGTPETPFLTWPSDCAAGPEKARVSADSWQEPGVYTSEETSIPGVTG